MNRKFPWNLSKLMPWDSLSDPGLRSCNSTTLDLLNDEACLHIMSSVPYPVALDAESDECYECGFTRMAIILEGNSSIVLNTEYASQYVYILKDKSCNFSYSFAEWGVYGLNITEDSCNSIWIIQKPNNPYFPILVALIAAVLAGLTWKLLQRAWNSKYMLEWRQGGSVITELENDLGNVTAAEGPKDPISPENLNSRRKMITRVKALDTFRGISIVLMIFVNYGGGGYWIFEHAPWNGLTVADLVFPWFAWIMGVSIALSLRSKLRSTVSRRKLFFAVVCRSLLLFALGLTLNTLGGYRNGLKEMRILGVLQRLGISYFVVASMETLLMKPQRMRIDGICLCIDDILECWKQWIVVILAVICHTCLTFLLKVPGCPVGYLGPGGLHCDGKYINCTGGAAGYIDRIVLGDNHVYQRPTFQNIYQNSMPYDPEGILGILTTVFLVFLGVQAGRILMTYKNSASRIIRWLIWSMLTGLTAGFLCRFSKEEGIIPVNKNLWSLSYVLATASMAFFLIAALFYVVDIKKWWEGHPFSFAGMNPVFLYVGHCLVKNMFPWFWEPFYNSHGELLAMNIWGTVLWLLISYILYYNNIFLSL